MPEHGKLDDGRQHCESSSRRNESRTIGYAPSERGITQATAQPNGHVHATDPTDDGTIHEPRQPEPEPAPAEPVPDPDSTSASTPTEPAPTAAATATATATTVPATTTTTPC